MSYRLLSHRAAAASTANNGAETRFRRTALGDLLGIPNDKVNDDRLYRAHDHLLPHKPALEVAHSRSGANLYKSIVESRNGLGNPCSEGLP